MASSGLDGAEDPGGALGAALERALMLELAETWAEINHNHFRGRLRRPVFMLLDGEGKLGAWDRRSRTLSLSRRLVLDRPWWMVREVLKHEIAHQFVDEALGVGGGEQTPHGPAFEAVCAQHGFDATAAGLPPPGPGRSDEPRAANPILRRITRLLALAESPNRHEAASAMEAAQRLMLKHNIEASVAAARDGFGYRHVGEPRGRVSAAEHVLAGLLARHFFVDVIWVPSYLPRRGRRGRILEMCGTPSNLEIAAYVHDFLLHTGERLWREHRRARGLTGDRERRRFLLGIMIGFDEKLGAAVEQCRREGLVWVGDPALAAYLARRYPRRSGGTGVGIPAAEATEHGRRAGRNIVLAKPIATGSGARGRLLT